MSAMLSKKTVILAKVEATYGTDPTPTEGANAIEAYDVSIVPTSEMKERYPGNDDLSPYPELRGKSNVEVKFTTYLKGSGTEGTAPRISPLFEACGLSETVVSTTSVTYEPLSATFVGCTFYVYLDGMQHIVSGCVGDLELDFVSGDYPKCIWTFKGVYTIPTDVALADPTFDSTTPEIVKGCTYTFGSYSAIIEKLNIKFNNKIAERPDFNQTEGIKGYQITGRMLDGTMTVESVLRSESNADFWAYFHSRTLKALSYVMGATGGNITTITAAKCYLRPPAWGDRDGVRTYELPFQMARDSGNDEISIALT